MRSISKGKPPAEMDAYLASTPSASFDDLRSSCGPAIRNQLLREQHGLCAFCCDRLGSATRIAHVVPQSEDQTKSTSFSNFVLSCNTQSMKEQSCDVAQGDQTLPVTPLQPHVESLFDFKISGQVSGTNDHASETIRILALDCGRLRQARRTAILAAIEQKRRTKPALWQKMLTGDFHPMPAFQPAIAQLVR
jgi:uncharacterized protein (TIGR02646 family)